MIVRRAEGGGPAARHAIAIMAKASEPGRTKTRLCPPLTLEEAAGFNTAFLKDVAANVARSAAGRSVAAYAAFGPPGSEGFFERELPEDVGLIETWHANFGECLWEAVETMFDLGHETACVLNSDSPTLPPDLLVEMVDALERPGDRAVLGPSTDGGYYLLALKGKHRSMFKEVAWSTDWVADQTRERAAELGLELVELPAWYDVDDAASLRCVTGECLFGEPYSASHPPSSALATADALRRLFATPDGAGRIGIVQ